jgi:hypothetical protein
MKNCCLTNASNSIKLSRESKPFASLNKPSLPTNYLYSNKSARQRQSRSPERESQLSLQLIKLPVSTCYTTIEPVPESISLGDDRFYVWLIEGEDRWRIPIQLRRFEVDGIISLIKGQTNRGIILRIVGRAVDGGVL